MNNNFIDIPSNFNPEDDFNNLNPQIKYIEPFSHLFNSDVDYSKTMWSIVLYSFSDESANKMYRLPPKERLEAIKRFNPDFNLNNELIKECVNKFPDKALSAVTRALIEEKEVLTLRGNILKEQYKEAAKERDLDTLVKLDNLIKNNPKFWDNYEKVESKYLDSKKIKATVYGGRQETFAEKKKI